MPFIIEVMVLQLKQYKSIDSEEVRRACPSSEQKVCTTKEPQGKRVRKWIKCNDK